HNTRRPAALKAPWRPAPERMPHQEYEIERARVDDQPLEDVRMPAQVDPAQPAGVIDVRKRPLDVLAATPHQPLPAWAAHATAIAIDRLLGLRLLGPAATAAIGLSEVAAEAEGLEGQQGVGRDHRRAPSGRSPARPPTVRPPSASSQEDSSCPRRPPRAGSRRPGRRSPDPPRARPCGRGGSVRLSSARPWHRGPTDSPTPCWTSASCAGGRAGPAPRGSAS